MSDGVTKNGRAASVSKVRGVLDGAASIAMVVAAIVLIWSVWKPQARPTLTPVPAEPISLAGAARMGDPRAAVAVVEFSDFECPFCARFSRDVLPALTETYVKTGRVQIAFRHMPASGHQRATPAAVVAACADQQGRFWPMHDALFSEPMRLDDAALEAHAQTVGLDVKQLAACRDPHGLERVQQDLAAAKRLKVRGTPTFFVGRRNDRDELVARTVLLGARSVKEFKTAIDEVEAERARP